MLPHLGHLRSTKLAASRWGFSFGAVGCLSLSRHSCAEGAMPTYCIIAKYQPKVDHKLFGHFLKLVTSARLKWTHDCNLDTENAFNDR